MIRISFYSPNTTSPLTTVKEIVENIHTLMIVAECDEFGRGIWNVGPDEEDFDENILIALVLYDCGDLRSRQNESHTDIFTIMTHDHSVPFIKQKFFETLIGFPFGLSKKHLNYMLRIMKNAFK